MNWKREELRGRPSQRTPAQYGAPGGTTQVPAHHPDYAAARRELARAVTLFPPGVNGAPRDPLERAAQILDNIRTAQSMLAGSANEEALNIERELHERLAADAPDLRTEAERWSAAKAALVNVKED